MELRTRARRPSGEHGLDLLIVDYLQLMQANTQSRDANRVQEVSEDQRGLKGLARELKVPVLGPLPAFAPAGDARVHVSLDFRTCASPRHRAGRGPGPLPVAERDKPGDESEIDGEVVNLRLAKHRNGPTGEVKLWFKKSQTRFMSYAGERYAEAV